MTKTRMKLCLWSALLCASVAYGSVNPFVGEIAWFPYTSTNPPVGYQFCNGQLLNISAFPILHSLIGTTYGGDGVTTFGVPNVLDRMVLGTGTGPGLTTRNLGAMGGENSVALNPTEIPAHNHTANASMDPATQTAPAGAALATGASGQNIYHEAPTNVTLSSKAVAPAGGNVPHENRMPFIRLRCAIATQGITPSP